MNKKQKNQKLIIALMIIVGLIFLTFVTVSVLKNSPSKEEQKEESSMSASVSEEEETLLVADETVGLPADNSDYSYRVTVTNLAELYDAIVLKRACDYLEPYLSEYLDYYVQDGQVYEAEYVIDSLYEDPRIPDFDIYIKELDLTIDCLFIPEANYYRFTSRFNPDGE